MSNFEKKDISTYDQETVNKISKSFKELNAQMLANGDISLDDLFGELYKEEIYEF